MGVIGNLVMRSASARERLEDESILYHDEHESEVVGSGEHRGAKYRILTDGIHPSVTAEFDQLFSCIGCDVVILDVNDKRMSCDRLLIYGKNLISHVFDDRQYSMNEMHHLAKSMIDAVLKMEKYFFNNGFNNFYFEEAKG